MREAGAPRTGELQCSRSYARPTGGSHALTTRGPAQRFKGAMRRPRQVRRGPSAAEDSIVAGVLHLASLQRSALILREDSYNVVTRAPALGNNLVVPDSKRERGVHARAMLFWVFAALAVVGTLAIDWALYLLVRRWL